MGKKLNLRQFAHDIVESEYIFNDIDVKEELLDILCYDLTKKQMINLDNYINIEKRYLKILKLKENVRVG